MDKNNDGKIQPKEMDSELWLDWDENCANATIGRVKEGNFE
jgi:hypothetical protein